MALSQDPNFDTSQFDLMRKKAEQRANQSKQENQGALQRRFAALGNLNSGAAIKTQQLAANESDAQKEDALAGVDAQQTAEVQRRKDIQGERDYASGEAEKGRAFQAAEGEKGRAFQDKVFNAEQGSRLRQLDLQEKQFSADREDQLYNKGIAYGQLSGGERAQLGNYLDAAKAGAGNPYKSAEQASIAQLAANIKKKGPMAGWG